MQVISDRMLKMLQDPRNEKVLDWLLQQPRIPEGTLLYDDTGLFTFRAKRRAKARS